MMILAMAPVLAASEATDKECLRFNDAAVKLQKACDESLAKERTRSITAIAAIAKQRAKANDLVGAEEAWRAVLGLDENHAEARKFFEAIGKLDAVLAGIKQASSIDLLGAAAGTADAGETAPRSVSIAGTVMPIAAVPGRKASLGALKAGTVITVQYVNGTWGRMNNGDAVMRSPDAAVTPARFRLRLTADPANPDATLAVVPSGTAQSPYSFTLATDCEAFYLCMNQDGGLENREGEVHYRVKVVAP
jgi:hypothetical protein